MHMDGTEFIREQLNMVRQRRLTVPEAAAVFDTDAAEIRRAVERGTLEASLEQRGARQHRLVAADHVLVWLMAKPLRPDYYKIISKSFFKPESWQVERNRVFLSFSSGDTTSAPKYLIYLDDVIGTVSKRLKELDDAQTRIETRKGADPVIKGTEIEAHRIAALLNGGVSVEDVLRDFPSLTREQVAAAAAYSKAYPKQGRPFPNRSAKSAMRAGRGGLRRAFAAADED